MKKYPNTLLVYVFLFAIVCGLVLVFIHAISPYSAIEPENGSINGNASKISDVSASGGGYLEFGITQTTVFIPNNIASDCSTDITPDLNAWIASLPNNTTAELKANACYLTEDQIDIVDKSHFILHGNNATFRRTQRKGNLLTGNHLHVRIARSDNIEVNNLIITGEKPDTEGYNSGLEAQHGFGLYGLLHGTLDNVRISSIHGDCFYLNSGLNRLSQYITIKNSFCHQSGRHGVAFLAASDVLITHSTIENNHRENFDFEPYGTGRGGANNVTIDNNIIGEASQLLISASGGSPELKNLVFSNNTIHRRFTLVFESANNGQRRGPLKILNNTSDSINHGSAINIHGFDDVTISGNRANFDGVNKAGDPNSYFLQIFYSKRIEISNNAAQGAVDIVNFDSFSSDYCGSGNTPTTVNLPNCIK